MIIKWVMHTNGAKSMDLNTLMWKWFQRKIKAHEQKFNKLKKNKNKLNKNKGKLSILIILKK